MEIDLLAYRARENEPLAIECKSYIDSRGVGMEAFDGRDPRFAARFKLFNQPDLRRVVLRRLALQLARSGACAPGPGSSRARRRAHALGRGKGYRSPMTRPIDHASLGILVGRDHQLNDDLSHVARDILELDAHHRDA